MSVDRAFLVLVHRARSLLRRRILDQELDDELRDHLEHLTERNLAKGLSPEEARRTALLAMEGLQQQKERCRDVRGVNAVDHLVQDVRYALRQLCRNPGFAASIVVTVALGVGANTAIFSVVNAVLLRPLAYPHPERVIVFMSTSPEGSYSGSSEAKFNAWRRLSDVFDDVAAYRFAPMNLRTVDHLEELTAEQVSANFFRLFDARIALGRGFSPDEYKPGGGDVVILSDTFWRLRLNRDGAIVGKTVLLEGRSYVAIGVMRAGFDGAALAGPDTFEPDVWVPLRIDPNSTDLGNSLTVAGRLRPDGTLSAARVRLNAAADNFRQQFRRNVRDADGFTVELFRDVLTRDERRPLVILACAVGLVLLIACANVANLLLAHAATRTREIAVRTALGASRSRIVRQLVTESLVVSMIGGTVGLTLGAVGIHALLATDGAAIARLGQESNVTVDWRVLGFSLLMSLSAGFTFGLFPALTGARVELQQTMNEASGYASSGLRQSRARTLFIVTEVSLAVVLMIGSALLIRTFAALRDVNPGFDAHNLLTLRLSLSDAAFAVTEGVERLVRDGEERLRHIPGVVTASAACCVPFENDLSLRYVIEGRRLEGPYHGMGSWRLVGPGYFDTLRIPLIRGRMFTERDTLAAPGVVIINDSMARQWWPGRDPLGERLSLGKGVGRVWDEPPRQIVGVVADVRDAALNRAPRATTYVPIAQTADGVTALNSRFMPLAWIVRTRVAPESVRSEVERELRLASGGMPITAVRAMDDVRTRSTARAAFRMWLMTVFGAAAAMLALVGIYGVVAYSVAQRSREIGIRLALGATTSHVRNMVLLQGLSIVGVGTLLGLGAASALAQVLAAFMFGVSPHDRLVFAGVPSILSVAAFLALLVPARRAARVDPMVALRAD